MQIVDVVYPPQGAITIENVIVEDERITCRDGGEPDITLYRVRDERSPFGFSYRVLINCKQQGR